MRPLALLIPLAACAAGGGYAPQGCEPGSPVRSSVGGFAAAGVGDEGSVADSDIDLTIAVTPGRPACR